MKQMEKQNEREAFQMARKLSKLLKYDFFILLNIKKNMI